MERVHQVRNITTFEGNCSLKLCLYNVVNEINGFVKRKILF